MLQDSIRQCYTKSEASNYCNTESDRKQPGSYKMAMEIFLLQRLAKMYKSLSLVYVSLAWP
jgi:hypothetical protein